jgi:hypothetical protein
VVVVVVVVMELMRWIKMFYCPLCW